MCGIAGFINIKSLSNHLDKDFILSRMASQLKHRGPDEWGYFIDAAAGVGIVHTRLAIIDQASGKQPMHFGHFVISFNGEIYNYRELRQELEQQGIVFVTNSDTEVLLKAYMTWGAKAFNRFNGEWACAIWDSKHQKLVLCRDRYGIRPLYLTKHRGYLYFSSETKAFDVIPEYRRKIDSQRLLEHGLLWNTLGDRSIFEEVRSVVPGTLLTVNTDGTESTIRYYSLPEENECTLSFDESQEQLHELLVDSVRLRMRSDVPVASYLSGGLDSTIIVGIVNRYLQQRLDSFSIEFADERLDESRWQKLAAGLFTLSHRQVHIADDDISGNIERALYHGERPIFRTAPIPMFLLSGLVSSFNYKVVLTGEGADEVFCGYDSFKETKLTRFWARHNRSLRTKLLLKQLYPHLAHYSDEKNLDLMAAFYQGYVEENDKTLSGIRIRLKNNAALVPFFSQEHKFNADIAYESLLYEVGTDGDWAQVQQRMEFSTLLRGYLLSAQGDRMSMAHSIETRFPFLDHRIVDFALKMPAKYKLKQFQQKHILKHCFRDLVPSEISHRPKLPYQAPDIKAFLKNGKFSDLIQHHLSQDAIRKTGLFDPRMVNKLLQKILRNSNYGYRDNMIFVFLLTSQICADQCSRNNLSDTRKDRPTIAINNMTIPGRTYELQD